MKVIINFKCHTFKIPNCTRKLQESICTNGRQNSDITSNKKIKFVDKRKMFAT